MMFFDFFLSSFRKLENRKFFNEDTDMSNMRRYFVYVGFVFIFNIYIYIELMMNYILTVLIDISIYVYNYLLCKLNYDYSILLLRVVYGLVR